MNTRRRGDLVSTGDTFKAKIKDELENLLDYCPETHYTEEDGVISKKVTQTDIYKAVKYLIRSDKVQGQFLLYLDDRITETNGYKEAILSLQEQVTKICTERDLTCPVAPLVKSVEELVADHINEQREEKLVLETKRDLMEKWKQEGVDEERARFEQEELRFRKKMGWIGAVATIITVGIAVTTFMLGLWGG